MDKSKRLLALQDRRSAAFEELMTAQEDIERLLAGMDDVVESEAKDIAFVSDHDWADAGQLPHAPRLDGLKTEVRQLSGVAHSLTFVEDVISSHVSAIASAWSAVAGTFASIIYVRYKGATYYRYISFTDKEWADLVTTQRQQLQALPVSLTVGEYIERVIKAAHELGSVRCEKLMPDGSWVTVLNRKQKAAAQQGKQAAEELEAALADLEAQPVESPAQTAEPTQLLDVAQTEGTIATGAEATQPAEDILEVPPVEDETPEWAKGLTPTSGVVVENTTTFVAPAMPPEGLIVTDEHLNVVGQTDGTGTVLPDTEESWPTNQPPPTEGQSETPAEEGQKGLGDTAEF